MSEKRIIEINGVKMEVDLRDAKNIETYKVGDFVKVLVKQYENRYESHPGVIIGFEPFQMLPSIIIAYVKIEYSSAELKTVCFNKATEGFEITKAIGDGDMQFDKGNVMEWFDREILKNEVAIADLKAKKEFFLRHFAKYVQPATEKKKKGWLKK